MLQFIRSRHPLEKVEAVLSSAGFRQTTPLQREYLPAALKGRDLIVESMSGEGKTIAQLLPYFLRPRSRRKTPALLILVKSVDEAKKYEVEFNRLSDSQTGKNSIAVLGKNPTAGTDLQLLTKYPALIVGTTERIIDHIRRNNLHFGSDLMVVVNIPEEEEHEKFDFDVEFIFTKLPPGVQKIIFTPDAVQAEKLTFLLKRPSQLFAADRRLLIPSLHVYRDGTRSPDTLTKLVLGVNFRKLLILAGSNEKVEELMHALNSRGLSCCRISPQLKEDSGGDDSFHCSLATFRDVQHIPLSYHSILLYGPPPADSFFQEIGRAVSGRSPAPFFSILLDREEGEIFSTQQETSKMKTTNEKFPQEPEILEGKLRQIMQLIREDEDPEVLNHYRKLIRKNVPLHLRGYLAAYLFKQSAGTGAGSIKKSSSGTTVSTGPIQTIFVSIGKNRKVFPRDLIKLFRKQLNLEQNEIGNIKVLDNYSFIDIPRHAAQKAIDTMDGIEFHGRTITVNFARKKKGETDGGSQG